ncbi:hypothetical protein SELMODRAFT_186716 [Selaginella moellendorffii]|uniref:Translation initiation factor eIF2B subunit beta n=1 Tax=Selaginella moellendorffii TaxID=88036 RepID=D8T9W6_SELML|nr:translation initiation factor eIF-2B subunit beta [Selaginella moellendorffii]XP_024521830.1 translation initiation factor eIF-2B subunit beta [Selaginella moellendorffii]EFJ06519.1 hypothetical protein SELMODRAFT_186716 [Selaginella moellendorffii]|eukprot:XP_002992369.1 translation initiation factor eIF-2B subunit beta [Selaginella moellendorffii]
MVAAAMPDLQAAVDDFVIKLKRRQVEGSLATAKSTVLLLRQVVSHQRIPSSGPASSLIDAVKSVGSRLIAANSMELAVGNMVRRVLHIIREEEATIVAAQVGVTPVSDSDDDADVDGVPGLSAVALAAANRTALRAPSLHNLLESLPTSAGANVEPVPESDTKSRSSDKNSKSWKLKHGVIDAIGLLLGEIENYHSEISEQALEHIHQNEVILTLGRSRSLLHFFREAKKKRSFQVFVAEGAPRYQGHKFAKELAAMELQTTVITDSAVFALISRVNMVIVGAHAVMANGGIVAPVGMHMVALAARRHAVPFVVLTGLHKLCPLYPHNPSVVLNELKSPSQVLDFGEMSDCLDGTDGSPVHVVNPMFDYVPPELISLFITDSGGHNPSYVYRLVAEIYSPEDH